MARNLDANSNQGTNSYLKLQKLIDFNVSFYLLSRDEIVKIIHGCNIRVTLIQVRTNLACLTPSPLPSSFELKSIPSPESRWRESIPQPWELAMKWHGSLSNDLANYLLKAPGNGIGQ